MHISEDLVSHSINKRMEVYFGLLSSRSHGGHKYRSVFFGGRAFYFWADLSCPIKCSVGLDDAMMLTPAAVVVVVILLLLLLHCSPGLCCSCSGACLIHSLWCWRRYLGETFLHYWTGKVGNALGGGGPSGISWTTHEACSMRLM